MLSPTFCPALGIHKDTVPSGEKVDQTICLFHMPIVVRTLFCTKLAHIYRIGTYTGSLPLKELKYLSFQNQSVNQSLALMWVRKSSGVEGNTDWCCVVCFSLSGVSDSKNHNFSLRYHRHYFWNFIIANLNTNCVSAKNYSTLVKSKGLVTAGTGTATWRTRVFSTDRGYWDAVLRELRKVLCLDAEIFPAYILVVTTPFHKSSFEEFKPFYC